MRRVRKTLKRIVESSDSEDDIPLKKLYQSPNNDPSTDGINAHSSSSDSDIENYLQPIDKIDLNSSFFKTHRRHEEEFSKVETDIFAGITRLSDSESDADKTEDKNISQLTKKELKQREIDGKPSTSGTRLNFQQLEEYTRQIDEAKKHVEIYNAKKKKSKKVEENNLDISNLLAVGESKQLTVESIKPEDLHSSDFESCNSEQEDWEEVKVKDSQDVKETNPIRKQDLQIIVDMPNACKKKKGVDLLAAMKRRLNRIRKENQVYVHKVHLLCWIAHGNYVNEVINNSEILSLALSLLPSDKCYPSDRTDLNYLEQIVHWYKSAIQLTEKYIANKSKLLNILKMQISKKEAYNQKMFVYIFVAILRALGIQCRLVLSFQVEPLRPPASELHSLANNTKIKAKDKDLKNETIVKPNKDKIALVTEKNSKTIKVKKFRSSNTLPSDKLEKLNNTENGDSKKGIIQNSLTKKPSEARANLTNIKEKKIKEKNRKPIILKTDKSEKKHSKDAGKGKIAEKQKSNKPVAMKTQKTEKFSHKEHVKGESKDTSHVRGIKTRTKNKTEDNRDAKMLQSKNGNSLKREKFPKKSKVEMVSQLDGVNDSDDDTDREFFISQLDGAGDKKEKEKSTSRKPDLKKLHSQKNICKVKVHPNRLKNLNNEYNSEDDFRPRSPFLKKNADSPKVSQNRKVNLDKLKSTSRKRDGQETLATTSKNQFDVKSDIISLVKGRIAEHKRVEKSRKVKRNSSLYESDSDSDFMPEPIKKKHHNDNDIDYFVAKPKVKQRVRVTKQESGKKILSSDSDPEKSGKKKGNNVWVEVFLESEEKWISVDVVRGQVHCINEIFTRATHPVSYIVAWNNNNNIKDVTKRYCTKHFNTITHRLRIDSKWWDESLKPFLGKYTARDKEEDDDINRQQLDQPLPKTVAEYKNHPLYALRRHLLKFEEIYPSDIQPIGFVRGEAVYPRICVHVCHSRDIWLKEAKVVKPGEKPYKIVKARPKYDKLSNKVITDQLLEIFGEWQTTDYEPPTASNGIVPRNAFGNVELFKSCMLPKGTVHLKLPSLNKVCRKMNIDCASAIVGFDFHGGWSHPVYDGFVICEEFVDSVVAAWELEQDEIERKENEKIEKRVYGNWKKLIKGLLIKERLKAKYDFGESSTSKENKEKKPKGPKFCTKKK